MTTATAPLSPETDRSHLQESLFAWLEPKAPPAQAPQPTPQPAPEAAAVTQTQRESDPEAPRSHPRRRRNPTSPTSGS